MAISGLPAGSAAALEVSGPSGFHRTLAGSDTLTGLSPGLYTISAAEVIIFGERYAPTPATQVVQIVAGAFSNAVEVVHSLRTGRLRLVVAGLPPGTVPSIMVTGPDGFARALSTPELLIGLTPGEYVVRAPGLAADGDSYAAAVDSQQVTVAAGIATPALVSVNYSTTTGRLIVGVHGLPPGAQAAIEVRGPGGFFRSVTGPDTLKGLLPGAYALAASPVHAGADIYAPATAGSSALVALGIPFVASIQYALGSGSLDIIVTGLPDGAAPPLTVTDGSGYSATLLGRTVLRGLLPGNYTIFASAVTIAGQTFMPAPSVQTVQVSAGRSAVVQTIEYTAGVGALRVSVDGLPGATSGNITVTGPGGFAQSVPFSRVFSGLTPGDYTVTAGTVVAGLVEYAPISPSQIVSVGVGAEAPAPVMYAAATGALSVTMGWPSGSAPNLAGALTVTGPAGFTATLTGSRILTGLRAGSYTLTATSVAAGGVDYVPFPAAQNVGVILGQTVGAVVTYTTAPALGGLNVMIGGLPNGAEAKVNVTGPAGYARTLSASQTLNGLVGGAYTITSEPVSVAGLGYTPAPLRQSVSVVPGQTAALQIAYSVSPSGPLVSVDTLARYQVMTGWEATAQIGHEEPGITGYLGWRDAVLDLAANDLGINRLRLPLRAGVENNQDRYLNMRSGMTTGWGCLRYETVNDNNDPFVMNSDGFKFSGVDSTVVNVVLPMRQRLAARGESLYLSLNYTAFGSQCGVPLVHLNPAEYAELMLAAFLHLRDVYGLVPDAVELILEPDNGTPFTGTLVGQAMVATAARLGAAGFHPAFIGPSTMSLANAVTYFDAIRQVPGASGLLTELSYHRYEGVSNANLAALAQRSSTFGVKTAMLEHIESGAEDLYLDLTMGQASAWQQYSLAFPTVDNGAHYYSIIGGQPVLGNRTRYLRQYFRYIRRGAQRVGASSSTGGLRPVAFQNPNGRLAVVILVEEPVTFTVRGLRPGVYGASHTSSGVTGAELGEHTVGANGMLSVTAPAGGVLTVYAK